MNQTENYPNKLQRIGTVMKMLDHDHYLVKKSCSGRLIKWNRSSSKLIYKPLKLTIDNAPPVQSLKSKKATTCTTKDMIEEIPKYGRCSS